VDFDNVLIGKFCDWNIKFFYGWIFLGRNVFEWNFYFSWKMNGDFILSGLGPLLLRIQAQLVKFH
jgi:hypothetical protein